MHARVRDWHVPCDACGERGGGVDQRPRIQSVAGNQGIASIVDTSSGSRSGWVKLGPGEKWADIESDAEGEGV